MTRGQRASGWSRATSSSPWPARRCSPLATWEPFNASCTRVTKSQLPGRAPASTSSRRRTPDARATQRRSRPSRASRARPVGDRSRRSSRPVDTRSTTPHSQIAVASRPVRVASQRARSRGSPSSNSTGSSRMMMPRSYSGVREQAVGVDELEAIARLAACSTGERRRAREPHARRRGRRAGARRTRAHAQRPAPNRVDPVASHVFAM